MMHAAPVTSGSDSLPAATAESIVPTSLREKFLEKALVGAASIVVVVTSIIAVSGLRGVLGAGLGLLMLAIAVVDGKRFIIPNRLTAAAFALGVAHAAMAMPLAVPEAVGFAILRGALLALAFFGLAAIYERLRARQGLGFGDVKLAGVAGVWLDWLTIPIVIQIAALAAIAVYAMHNLARGRPLRVTARLPFGLFFAPAIWLGWLLESMLVYRLD